MFLTKKHIPRRTFLRGAGVTLALPLLDSMIPAQTPLKNSAANPRTRFLAVYNAHGWSPGYWFPEKAGPIGELPMILKPYEAYKDRMTVISGHDCTGSMPPPGSSGGDHSRTAAALTGCAPKKTAGPDLYLGTSVDQIIAKKFGQDTLLPSIQLGLEDPGSNTGVCGYGYGCAYTNSVSWESPSKPLPHEVNPQIVFERLFGDGSTAEERLARKQTTGSILDSVTHTVERLQRTLPASDRHRLDGYLEDVRELERRLQIAAKASIDTPSIEVPAGVPESFDDHVKLLYDLQYLAFRAEITRVSAMMYSRDVSLRSYPESGVLTANHPSSHHGEDPKRRLDWAKIGRYHHSTLAYFLKKLKATPDGEGTLFDNTFILWATNMGNANQHSHINCGHMFLGGASGRHKGSGFISSSGPSADILLTALHIMGVDQKSIGDSVKPVALET